jgi:hypothetical protein
LIDAFELWMMTLDPLKVATESFQHENHRKMLAEHEARKRNPLPVEPLPRPKKKQREITLKSKADEVVFTAWQLDLADRLFKREN